MCFAVNRNLFRDKVNGSASGPSGSATKEKISAVSVTLRAELLEFKLSGELFQFELRELHFALLFQLPPNMLRDISIHPFLLRENLKT